MKFNVVTSGDGQNRDLLSQCDFYIALVTPSFVTNESCLLEIKDAQALEKKMFALVKRETKLPNDFFNYNWKLIIFFSTEKEFALANHFLLEFLKK